MNDLQKHNREESRKQGMVASSVQNPIFWAVVYQSAYDKAALADPIWMCSHNHSSSYEAEICANDEIKSGRLDSMFKYNNET